jgi:predicted 3-demethylubiquinone-9 3-methyltransferase (glyoxalase superfamily)
MVKDIVEKTMRKAINNFAEKEEVETTSINFFIHTKNEELTPQYFYAIDGKVVQENGKTKELNFVKDILGVKFDLTGKSLMSSQYLANYFQILSEEEKKEAKNLYIMIRSTDLEVKKLGVSLFNNNIKIKDLELEEIFGE